MIEKLDENSFLLYSAKQYDNRQCYDTIEFYDDLKRFKYLKRLFNIYIETGELRERLILNHIIILYNVFGAEAATRMLFFKLLDYKEQLKPFIDFLNYLPATVEAIGLKGININTAEIISDKLIEEKLKTI